MKMFYAVWNHYGNNTIGYDSLHIFETKAARDAWNQDDPENKKMSVKASNSLVRKFNSAIEDTHGFHYTYHYEDGRVSQMFRDNGHQYEEPFVSENILRGAFGNKPEEPSDETIAKWSEELRAKDEEEFSKI